MITTKVMQQSESGRGVLLAGNHRQADKQIDWTDQLAGQ